MKKITKNTNKKGVILIEAILALAIIVIIMTALVAALISSVSSTNFSKNQSLATNYAQDGLEVARGQKDSDFNTFSTFDGLYCLSDNQVLEQTDEPVTDVSDCSQNISNGNANYFTRTIYINPRGKDERSAPKDMCSQSAGSIFVASTVSWSDSKCTDDSTDCHKVELNSCFVNLNSVPVP